MNEKPSIKKNFIYSICYQVLTLITPLVTAPYIARILGVNEIGIYSFTQSVASYFVFFAAIGSGTHGQRGVAGHRDSKHKMSVFAWEVILLKIATAMFSLVLFLAFAITIGRNYLWVYILQSLAIIATGVDITWLYQGLEDFKSTVIRQIGIKILGIIMILSFVKDAKDLPIYVLCSTLPTLLGNLCLWPKINSVIEHVNRSELHPFRQLTPEIKLFIPYMATTLFSYVDKTMLGYMCTGNTENGYYEQAMKFISIAVGVVSALSTVLIPRMAYYFKNAKGNEAVAFAERGAKAVMLISCLLCGGLLSVGPSVIPWFYGDGYERSGFLLKILAFVVMFKGINNYFGSAILIPSYKQEKLAVAIWATVIINVGLNSVMISKQGAIGASVASALSELVLFLILLYDVRESIDGRRFVKGTYKYFVACGLMAITTGFLSKYLLPSMLNSMILVGCACVIYFGCLIIFKEEVAASLISVVLNKLSYKNTK